MKPLAFTLLSASLGLLTVPPLHAQATASKPQPQSAVAQEFLRKAGPGWKVRMSADNRRIESVVGFGTRSYGDKPEAAARSFLTENASLFGLKADLSDLRVLSTVQTNSSGHVEFQQLVAGLPVENARVRVNLSKDGRVLEVKNSYQPFAVTPVAPRITREQAVESAIQDLLNPKDKPTPGKPRPGAKPQPPVPVSRDQLQLSGAPLVNDVYFAVGTDLRRAYKVLIKAKVPFAIREVIVDVDGGQILRSRSLINYFDDGTGQVFIPNPVNSLNNNGLTDSNYSTQPHTSDNPNPYYTRTLLDLDPPVGGKYKLTGPFVTLEEIESPTHAPPSESTATFVYQRSDANFDDVMVYYHIDAMERYIQLLGFIHVNNRRVRVDSDGFPKTDPNCGTPDANGECDNSHYVPDGSGTGYIAYGRGGVDDDEDADIIAHEYGHSIQDNTNPGAYPSSGDAGAMGEGFGDYWAVSMFSAETIANGHTLACVGEWDATFYNLTDVPHCLRRTDTNKTMDDFVTGGDVHSNGEIWSNALFNLFNTLGRTTTDRIVLQSHFNVPSSGPTFKEAGDAMLTADLQQFFGTHITALCKEFEARKIYKSTDCPTLPPNTGAQSTLFVLASFNETGLGTVTLAQATNIANGMAAYLQEGSFGQATIGTPATRAVTLANNRAHYYDQTTGNMLVDMVQEVINLVHAAEPGFDFTVVDRLFILTNDNGAGGETSGLKEWATTGPWPYAIPSGAGTKRFSASVHRADQSAAQFDHALGHHFGMFDLYPHEGVTFPRPYADGWSNMAKDPSGNFNDVHFFAWDKLKPGWVADANIKFIPRPPADPDPAHKTEEFINVFKDETALGSPMVIQVGTTPNVSKRSDERVSYYIEARKKAGTYDSNIPSDAVLVYYVNEDIGQGFGPVRLIDANPGTSNDLTDAGLLPAPATSTLTNIDSIGLNVEVLPKTGTEDYRVHITYDPPEDQNDVWIHPHDGNWKSPDIWVDSPACNNGVCGFDTDNGRTEVDRGDLPQPNVINRLYARIYNHGPGTAHNVRVDFFISEPHHAIDGGDVDPDTGDNVSWNEHFFTVIPDLPPTDAGQAVFVNWAPTTPPSSDHVHTCVKVKIATVFNDINAANQASQENIDAYDLTSHSPYPPVVDDFRVANPYDHPILAYLRADDVPAGWTADIVPSKAYLPVGGSVDARMTIQAPLSYPICSTEFIKATAWYPAGDTLVPLGASVAQVNLKKSTDLTSHTTYGSCDKRTVGVAASAGPSTNATSGGQCQVMTTQGCTNPPRPYEHITLTYTGPDGKPIYHDVVTDKNGCFEDFVVNPQGGPWSVQTQYPGNVCNARTDGGTQTVFVPPFGGGVVPPPRGGLWYSFHLGLNSPFGNFKRAFDPGPSLTVDAEYPFRDNLSLVAMFGLHVFGGNPNNFYYRNFSVDAKRYFPFGWTRLYVQAGPGVYLPKTGANVFGVNVGTGISFPVLPRLKIEVGPDLHYVDPSGLKHFFIDAKMGVVFHF
jgi:M6 family metalloprotease-like protein